MSAFSRGDYAQFRKQEKIAKREAKLDTLLLIAKARELGLIKKRNILKMDEKVNADVRKFLKQSCPLKYEPTLPEVMMDISKVSSSSSLKSLPILNTVSVPRNQNRWLCLPDDLRRNEVKRMHNFLFDTGKCKKHDKKEVMPQSLSIDI